MDDYDREDQKERAPRKPRDRDLPYSPTMLDVRQVFRCAMCGAMIPAQIGITIGSQCSKCRADLHTCKNCVHFDPGSPYECTEPVQARIARKDLGNECEFFEARKTVERETTTAPSSIKDPRAAFDRLFKK
jgi:hypothetical protein